MAGFGGAVRSVLRHIVDYAVPPRCPACGVIVPDDHQFCLSCWQQQQFLAPPWCARCHVPLPPHPMALPEGDDDRECASCLADPPLHDGLDAVLAYGDAARTVAIRLKHGRRTGLAVMIARYMQRYVPAVDDACTDAQPWIVVPVPLHRWRIWSRGFNQSALIARELARLHPLQFHPDMLERIKRTPMLRGMSGTQRRAILRGAIRVNPKRRDAIAGRNIVLIDDVHTSGATTSACVAALKRAKAGRVRIICWARVLPDAARAIDNDGDASNMYFDA